MNSIDLSIIIPIYNLEDYIQECLDSIRQSLKELTNVEVLLIDDGSTDDSKKKIESYVSDSRFHYYYQENQGVSQARNYGIQLSKGKYITFIDGDDKVSSDYFSILLKQFKEDIELLCFNYKVFDDNCIRDSFALNEGCIAVNKGDGFKGYLLNQFQKEIAASVWNKIFKRELLIKHNIYFDTHKKRGEDILFNVLYIEHISKIHIINQYLYLYRNRPSSAVHSYQEDFVQENIRFYDSFTSLYKQCNMEPNMKHLSTFYLSRWFGCIYNEAKSNSFQQGWKQLKKFNQYPTYVHYRNQITFKDLPKKLKMYKVLSSCHMTLPIYVLMYIKHHL